jgi:hypothetical protein
MSNILTNNINPRSGNLITIGGANDRVSIAGTLSYEDVTNIDSVGIITAQSGLQVTGGNMTVGGTTNSFGRLQITQSSDTDEGGLGIVDSTIARSMRLYCTTTNAVVNSGNGGTGNLILNEGVGKVGIGTDNPINNLHLNNSTTGVGPVIQLTNDTGDCRLFFGQNTTVGSANAQGQLRYNVAGNYMATYTAGSERMRIDADGKVAIGVAPNAGWQSSDVSTVLQVERGVLFDYSGVQFDMGRNYYYDGSAYRYIAAGDAQRIALFDENFIFNSAANSTADAAISWNEGMRLDSSGRLLIGLTSSSGDSLLQVNGPIQFQQTKLASHSRAYTTSTTATGLFGIQMTSGHGFAELTWAFVDSSYPNGVRMGKIYITFRGSGSNITAVTSTYTTENSITNGTVATISWTASVANTSNIRLNATASTNGAAGTLYLYGSSPFFDGLTPIANA